MGVLPPRCVPAGAQAGHPRLVMWAGDPEPENIDGATLRDAQWLTVRIFSGRAAGLTFNWYVEVASSKRCTMAGTQRPWDALWYSTFVPGCSLEPPSGRRILSGGAHG